MNKVLVSCLCFCLALLAAAGRAEQEPPSDIPGGTIASTTGASREEKVAWFREAKFGLFIHWGLYALPAGQWQGQEFPGNGEWIMSRAKIPVAEYSELASRFNPTKFDADAWVQLAKRAGMRYLTITAKHHDGFAMFSSEVSSFNIVDASPFKRDPIQELAEACHRHGLRLGFYYSQSQDWHHPGGEAWGGWWDTHQEGDFDEYLRTIAEPQVMELLTNYGPVSQLWFDTPVDATERRVKPFIDAIGRLQPQCLINSRVAVPTGDILQLPAEELAKQADVFGFDYLSRGDNEVPPQPMSIPWETPATLNDTWGYKKNDHNWKSPDELVFKLVDIVSKGGNYLLNVGPTAEGEIPQESQELLLAVGRWLKINGEAIHGAGPTPFGAEFGHFDPTKEFRLDDKNWRHHPEFIVEKQWRCTTKPGRLFIHLFQWTPSGKFELDGLKQPATWAYLLADADRTPLGMTQSGDKLTVGLPAQSSGEFATVLCIELADRER